MTVNAQWVECFSELGLGLAEEEKALALTALIIGLGCLTRHGPGKCLLPDPPCFLFLFLKVIEGQAQTARPGSRGTSTWKLQAWSLEPDGLGSA